MLKNAYEYANICGNTSLSFIIDEYKERDRRPVLNLLLKGNGRPIYFSSIDLSMEAITSKNLSNLIESELNNVVDTNRIVSVTSDNCNSMVSISKHIFRNNTIKIEQVGCVCHILNLLVEKSLASIEIFNRMHSIILLLVQNIENRKVNTILL